MPISCETSKYFTVPRHPSMTSSSTVQAEILGRSIHPVPVAATLTVRSARTVATKDTWGDLMQAANEGNVSAYTPLLSQLNAWLRRYYSHRLPSSMVDDATQETLLAIYVRRRTYEHGRPFKAWARGIARYKWIDHIRAAKRNPAAPCGEGEIEGIVSNDDHASITLSAIVLESLLSRLSPGQADVIRLVKINGFSISEASAVTGQSESLVKVNIHRGILKLSAVAAGYNDSPQTQSIRVM